MNKILLIMKGHFRPYLSAAMPDGSLVKSNSNAQNHRSEAHQTRSSPRIGTLYEIIWLAKVSYKGWRRLPQHKGNSPSNLGRDLAKLF